MFRTTDIVISLLHTSGVTHPDAITRRRVDNGSGMMLEEESKITVDLIGIKYHQHASLLKSSNQKGILFRGLNKLPVAAPKLIADLASWKWGRSSLSSEGVTLARGRRSLHTITNSDTLVQLVFLAELEFARHRKFASSRI
jgi:hypothetical protein